MRRRTFRKPAVSVALFPFLAVLVCTMGALIVLLVLMVQQARVYATGLVASQRDQPDAGEELALEADRHLWRREILEQQRKGMTQDLADHRLQLSHLEDHIRRLESKWKQLQAAADQLLQLASASSRDHQTADAALARVQQQLVQARHDLELARQAAARQKRSFAVIPYAGPQGTQRRPIYVECTEQGIVLQPEGVVLTAADFDGPLGPGNPLDAALRATREHWARLGLQTGEPYPLLLVRPDGALAYNVAREAINAWDDEFGYELIDADMLLKYPPPDPSLKQLLEETLRDARERQSILAAAMPSQFQGESPGGFVAAPHGGFVPLEGQRRAGAGGRGRRPGSSTAHGSGRETSSPGSPRSESPGSESPGSGTPHATGRPRAQYSRQDSTHAGGAGNSGGIHATPTAVGGASMSLADQRGNNWALPQTANATTAVTRPVAVACYRDRWAILPEQGSASEPLVVSTSQGSLAAIDELVEAIQDQIAAWGISLPGGYWKPLLEVYVTPGAEKSFEELRALLSNSGFQVERVVP